MRRTGLANPEQISGCASTSRVPSIQMLRRYRRARSCDRSRRFESPHLRVLDTPGLRLPSIAPLTSVSSCRKLRRVVGSGGKRQRWDLMFYRPMLLHGEIVRRVINHWWWR
jgi:hypothetical protein